MKTKSELYRVRSTYSKIKNAPVIPDLVQMQKLSYDAFLRLNDNQEYKSKKDVISILNSFFPIYSNDGSFVLELVNCRFGESKYLHQDCHSRGVTYALPFYVTFRLTTNDVDKALGSVVLKDVKEQEIMLCEFPIMTDSGTFIVNGTERVIVSQIYRSPGVFFDQAKDKSTTSKSLYTASVLSNNGSWLDVEFDNKDLMYFKIDKRKKIPLLYLLRSLYNVNEQDRNTVEIENLQGMSNANILTAFYPITHAVVNSDGFIVDFNSDFYKNVILSYDLIDADTKEVIVQKGTYVSKGVLLKLAKSNVKSILLSVDNLVNSYIAESVYDNAGNLLIEECSCLTEDLLSLILKNAHHINSLNLILADVIQVNPYIINSLNIDPHADRVKALNEIYRNLKGTDCPNYTIAENTFYSLFFDQSRYDLGAVGRYKLNRKLGLDVPEDCYVLTTKDIIEVIKYLVELRNGNRQTDDIDHLGNRVVRSVGELVEEDFRIAIVRLKRYIEEKFSGITEDVMPSDVINPRIVQSALRDFFSSSQLSQFMDQTNPLSEITHKRRISALGPKGLTRDRASFEVRDVHLTHYGRICPVETPEGPNIGLINSLAMYANIDKYGLLQTPYKVVKDAKVTDEICYLNANQEIDMVIAQSDSELDNSNKLIDELVTCRVNGEVSFYPPHQVDYIDVSPNQLVSVAAALVPFLENDDANRALMGANMQRQAVPLLNPEAPFVATGIESLVARDSGACVIAKNSGIVHSVDAGRILIEVTNYPDQLPYSLDIYDLKKFQRSNYNTCIHQIPVVEVGQFVKQGEIIADGHSVDHGELALGRNVLAAFMPWNGYNFEDSILVSERVVKEDLFTSVHIDEFEVVARDTKLGAEEITADIPNIGDNLLKNLDESGIISVGAEINAGDILVGKITPKAESVITAEEKLLRAIFAEKAIDVKDTSFRVPSGVRGVVVGVKVLNRRGVEKDSRTKSIDRQDIESLMKDKEHDLHLLSQIYKNSLQHLLQANDIQFDEKKFNKDGVSSILKSLDKDGDIYLQVSELSAKYQQDCDKINEKIAIKTNIFNKGDDLPVGVLKVVKVYVAVKRKLQSGDKMAGRHGNKGVISKVLPVEDMPYLPDGTPVDVCLNPLGVPSRMNIGQILELHLGWACFNVGKQITNKLALYDQGKSSIAEIRDFILNCYQEDSQVNSIKDLSDDEVLELAHNLKAGLYVATPVFDGVKEKDINNLFSLCNLDHSGQMVLTDGRTGEKFDRPVSVGYIYMLKLHHLVDDKIHARSVGPYSLITQQPLGGKAQFGGQRFGEMEVWALEAYGASHILREMLTIKSDDRNGRNQVYEAIIRGEEMFNTGIPESFNVLVKELRSLCLNLEMKKNDE